MMRPDPRIIRTRRTSNARAGTAYARSVRVSAALIAAVLSLPLMWASVTSALSQSPTDSGSKSPSTVSIAGDPITVELLGTTWPSRPRLRGYEFNQKNHQATPEFVDRGGLMRSNPATGKRYRVVGLRFRNSDPAPVRLRYRSDRLDRGETHTIEVPAHGFATRYYAVRVDAEKEYDLKIDRRDPDASVLERSLHLGPAARETRDGREAQSVATELTREDAVRRELAPRDVVIRIRDDFDGPVPLARVLLLRDEGLMVYEGETDDAGHWHGPVLPGSYRVFAFRTIPPTKRRDNQTEAIPRPRILMLSGRLDAAAVDLSLAPTKTIEGVVQDVDGGVIPMRRLWVTPKELAQSYRYATVAARVASRARAVYTGAAETSGFLVLTNGSPFTVSVHGELDPTHSVLLRQDVLDQPDTVRVVFDPALSGRAVFDPPSGPGSGQRGRVDVLAAEGVREQITVDTDELHTFFLPPAGYRVSTRYLTKKKSVVELLPYRMALAAGQVYDLTPRAPFTPSVHYERLGKKVQFWLAVTDSVGRVLARPPGPVRRFSKNARGVETTDITNPRWELAAGSEQVDLKTMFAAIELEFDGKTVRGTPKVQPFERRTVKGATGQAPAPLADRLAELLPEVARAVVGSTRFLNLPPSPRSQHMNFDVLLPPGVGGTGGGTTITLDIAALFPFATGSDVFPGAFRHELGHCLGFGHDPYMLLAPTGIDEERFGSFGYRMLHAGSFQRALSYLHRNRHEIREPWQPNDGVFAVLRMLYGEDVHRKMFQERKVAEKTLTLNGLSSIERIATLYSLGLERNVAWVFRAMGWPVTDAAVEMGANSVHFARKHPPQLNYAKVHGTPLLAWWVYGPVQSLDDESTGWRRVEWPSRFVRLDEDRDPPSGVQRYLLYRTVSSPKDIDARILCASDVQLEIRVNGVTVANADASPQYSQPLHDEAMLDQKRPYAVTLYKGENVIEVAVNQPPGARGFLLEFIKPDGSALPLALGADGPPGQTLNDEITRLRLGDSVLNGGFDIADGRSTGWIRGPIDGSMRFDVDRETFVSGPASLRARIDGSTRGGFIQRVVVEPEKSYLLSAALRSRGLKGKAYVSLFTQDVHGRLVRTESLDAKDAPGQVRDWRRVEAKWSPGPRRVVYVACYVEATAGTVWFDNVSLTLRD